MCLIEEALFDLKQTSNYFLLSVFLFVFLLTFFVTFTTAYAVESCFQATDSCEAFQSFRKKTNPSKVYLEKDKLYTVLEKSKRMSAFRVHIKGVNPSARWVAGSCGVFLANCNTNIKRQNKKSKADKTKQRRKPPQYLLALSWQPSFCESHSGKKECRTQTRNRYDATHWSLHGLWPQPRSNAYCGVSDIDKGIDRNKKWHLLEPVKLSQKTATALAFTMPGIASNLQRHEWVKHGTCYGSDADEYYSDAINLTQQINNSIVGKLFTKGVGRRVTLKQVRQHFDKAFGKGSGSKVDMRCDRKGLVSELWINLKGEVNSDTKISSLLKEAIRAGSKCKIGKIDRANH